MLCRLEIMPYTVRCVPETPSASLNSWLKSRFSEPSANILQYVVGSIVCAFYEAATMLHCTLLRVFSNVDSKTAWMGACGVVGLAVTVAAWLAFYVIIASSFIIQGVLHYAAVVTGFVGLGLGAAGALYFSKEVVDSATPGAGSGGGTTEYYHHSTVTTSQQHNRRHDD